MENFRFVALYYLNDWYQVDRHFVSDLSSASRSDRLRCIQRAASYYGIIRNFKKIDEQERLGSALASLEDMPTSITDSDVDSTVHNLACSFQSVYGQYAISAASKFLWIKHQSPVVIYDTRAIHSLVSLGATLREGYYEAYRGEWRKQFAIREKSIRSACAELISVKRFTLADSTPDVELRSIIGMNWFHERVFDKFLWWNNGSG